jgi:hypothetical protein
MLFSVALVLLNICLLDTHMCLSWWVTFSLLVCYAACLVLDSREHILITRVTKENPRASVEEMEKKNSCSYRDSNSDSSIL